MPAKTQRLLITFMTIASAVLIAVLYTDVRAEDHEGHEEEHWEDEHWEEVERDMLHVELARNHIEMITQGIELAHQLTESLEEETTAATLAIMKLDEIIEDPEVVAEFLEDQLESTKNEVTRRLIRLKLAEAYAHTDEQDKALEHLGQIIKGKD